MGVILECWFPSGRFGTQHRGHQGRLAPCTPTVQNPKPETHTPTTVAVGDIETMTGTLPVVRSLPQPGSLDKPQPWRTDAQLLPIHRGTGDISTPHLTTPTAVRNPHWVPA